MEHLKEKIRNVFEKNFSKELSEEEVNILLEEILLNSRAKLSKIKGFTEEKFQRYLQSEKYINSDLEIVFSPLSIDIEVMRIIKRIGIEALEKSSKYKRLYEMVNAVCLCLAINKIYDEKWLIKAQDNPDILLVKINDNRFFNEKPIDAISLEIMQVPVQIIKGFTDNIEDKIAEFIKEKKFNKRYGNKPHLLIHLNFDYEGFDLEKLSKKLISLSNNPFYQIWIRTNTDPAFSTMNIAIVYPRYSAIDIDFKKERNLYY
jgi:hypothetical protein